MTELPPRRRRERPKLFEWTVFVVAGALALFLVYEVAKRRVKPAPQRPVSLYAEAPPAPSSSLPPSQQEPPERALKGRTAAFKTERRKPRKKLDVPAPRR